MCTALGCRYGRHLDRHAQPRWKIGDAFTWATATKASRSTTRPQQEKRIQAAVEQGIAEGKTAVLLKAEKKVRLADSVPRRRRAATAEGIKLHVAVMEKDK